MSTKIHPLADYVVIQPDKAEEKTKSGILLTQGAQKKPETATVVGIGKAVKSVQPGDKVLFIDEYGKTKAVELDENEYILVKEENIIATVK